MKLTAHPNRKDALIRWNVVIRVILVTIAVFLISLAVSYEIVIALPLHRRREEERAIESVELQRLVMRVSQIEIFVHLPANQ
jgi:hypothetical protein